ncbi:MAG: c-type cytochrome, partial [Candidatus Omnitrophica bacterium]|nr:c-type cytochrome [Candidatus Omnitrophota bacterium]
MAKETPALYSVSKTFVWFAVVSALLFGSLIGIVLLDHKREWKEWQKKFIAFQYEKAKEEFRKAEEKVNKKEWEGLRKQAEEAEEALRLKRRDHRAMEEELRSLDARTAKTRGRYQDLKQYQDSYRYYLEETRLHQDPRAAQYEKKLAAVSAKLETARLQVETLEKESEAKQRILDAASAHAKELEQKMNKVMEDKRRVEKTLESLKPSLAKELLNAPMVDFMAPTLRVQQVVLEDLYDDYHFAKTQKVDRCMTCHLGIDQKGFEDAPQPFKTHPKLDLFLSPNSPHPLEKAGCTVCHGGNGHSVSFGDSAHTPRNDEERRRWQKQYGWRDLEKWEAKMLPLNHVEASCAKCHRDTVEVPKAQKLNRGRQLAEASGCFNCHKVQGFEDRWKVGPSLERVQSKLTQDWIVRWLQDPKAFRPATPMPRIFHLPNTSSPEDRQKSHALIEAMAAYLIKNSDSVELADPPAEGDPKRGERLVKEVGCLGCHSTSAVQGDPFAPPLSHLGSKVSAAWLYSWLKEPKHYSKDTRMPNLRLSGEEAADIAQYLLQERSVSFEKQALPKVEPKVLDEMILGYLQGTMRRVDAE